MTFDGAVFFGVEELFPELNEPVSAYFRRGYLCSDWGWEKRKMAEGRDGGNVKGIAENT